MMIAEMVDPGALPNLRLANKALCSAAGDAAIFLRPSKDITPDQLQELCTLFSAAGSLDLSNSKALNNTSLVHVQLLAPKLRSLHLDDCDWLWSNGLEFLTVLSNLEILSLKRSQEFNVLPDGFSNLGKLRVLTLDCCHALRIPDKSSLSTLTRLEELSLMDVPLLVEAVPEVKP